MAGEMIQQPELTEDEIKKGRRIPLLEFNELCVLGKIKRAEVSGFGDGYGEPYNPKRLVFGYINDELVWSET